MAQLIDDIKEELRGFWSKLRNKHQVQSWPKPDKPYDVGNTLEPDTFDEDSLDDILNVKEKKQEDPVDWYGSPAMSAVVITAGPVNSWFTTQPGSAWSSTGGMTATVPAKKGGLDTLDNILGLDNDD
jgi:hypothetical protein